MTVCRQCNQDVPAHSHAGRPRFYCSSQCQRLAARSYHRPVLARRCVQCSAPFETTNRKTMCCSEACGNALAQTVRAAAATERRRRVCETCGSSFIARNPSGKARAGNSQEGRFCSRLCAASARRGAADA